MWKEGHTICMSNCVIDHLQNEKRLTIAVNGVNHTQETLKNYSRDFHCLCNIKKFHSLLKHCAWLIVVKIF